MKHENIIHLLKKHGFELHDEFLDFSDILIKECIRLIMAEDTTIDAIRSIKQHFK